MKMKDFISRLDEERIVEGIRNVELRTSAEIRVFVTRRKLRGKSAIECAKEEFVRLGMSKTALRNGVLIFIDPAQRNFAMIGDQGIHERCGQLFWDEAATTMEYHFREARFTEGILACLASVGELLGLHFPRSPDDRNELPDEIAHDD